MKVPSPGPDPWCSRIHARWGISLAEFIKWFKTLHQLSLDPSLNPSHTVPVRYRAAGEKFIAGHRSSSSKAQLWKPLTAKGLSLPEGRQ